MKWTEKQKSELRKLYPNYSNREIAKMTGWDYTDILYTAKNMGLKKLSHAKARAAGKIQCTPEMEEFLRKNYKNMTNPQLAQALGLRLTKTREFLYKLGLQRIEMEYWTPEQIQYLLDNYKSTGNQRMANHLNQHYPKKKRWTKNHIIKKMKYLGLSRTKKELASIASAESSPGGLRFTILENSSSLNLHPVWLSQQIAWRNKALQKIVLEHPELIEAKKQQILINRKIRNHGK